MRNRRIQQKMLRALRRGLTVAAVMAFFVAALGVPLPRGAVKDRSVPFPCMDRACGCHDAAECKAHCCCFTSDEKLAWAADHDVDPEPFVDEQALVDAGSGRAADGETPPCHEGAVAACCAKKALAPPAAERLELQRATDEPTEFLSIAAFRQCTGLSPLWTWLGAALPPAKSLDYEFQWVVTGRVATWNCHPTSLTFSPPTPPPRA
jgi:hypothetical protein